MKNWRLLVTRPEQDSQVLAQALQEQHIFSFCLPLLAIQELPEDAQAREMILHLDRYSAVIVVSKPAARLAIERVDQYWAQPLAEQTWFSVGAATAAILRDYGFSTSYPATGDDSEALLAHPAFQQVLAQAFTPRVLIIRGSTGREFLAEELRKKGVEVDFLPLYQRYLPDYPTHYLINSIQQHQINGLTVSSEQGLNNLITLAAENWTAICHLPLFVPSPRVAHSARMQGATNVIDCAGASNQALIAALHKHSPQTHKD